MIINHNMNAMNAQRNMATNIGTAGKSMEKLSSGLRINRAGDDAAGLSISEKMRGQIRGLDQASRNSQDGISLIQTAEGALTETHSILQRMRELSVQAANDTNVTADRTAIKTEMDELVKEVDRIGDKTTFNEQKLLDGTAKSLKFQIGADKGTSMTLKIATMKSGALSVNALAVDTFTKAASAVAKVDAAIKTVSAERSKLGANQNRLEHTINNLNNASENIQGAESRVRDVDMAKEMMSFSKNNILQQAAQAMLAQANQQPQGVLQLLR
ncbi:flagellin [Clostridium uliginosum]|uniref:Flagellin n=1 Tax=Clostridium uliginosum TaxID=119641 RepID=A0A1I1KTD2_9CLOT|nr:flagellin [Clostridium uliginosum]SFC60710.1 flagellin [Clostridium uliginosum]